MQHLALAVTDRDRSQRFYETYVGFGAQPPHEFDGGVLMLYNGAGFSLALGPVDGPVVLPPFLHFGILVPDADQVRAMRDRLVDDGVKIVEESDEPGYVSVKFLDPDGYTVEIAWDAVHEDRRLS